MQENGGEPTVVFFVTVLLEGKVHELVEQITVAERLPRHEGSDDDDDKGNGDGHLIVLLGDWVIELLGY